MIGLCVGVVRCSNSPHSRVAPRFDPAEMFALFALHIYCGTQWAKELSAITQVKQIKLAANWLIGERLCKAAKSKFSRNKRSAHLQTVIAPSEGIWEVGNVRS